MDERLLAMREEITKVDQEMIALFVRRMKAAEQVAEIKRTNNLAIFDPTREAVVVENAKKIAGETYAGEAAVLSRTLMALSRGRQRQAMLGERMHLPNFLEPKEIQSIAYFGVEGSFTQEAASKLFPTITGQGRETFEEVFLAVRDHKVDVGVVPIENSLNGAINEVYGLLRHYGCFITHETVLAIEQCLLVVPGTTLEEIQEVTSHPEALKQCRGTLAKYGWKQTPNTSTAMATQSVAQRGDHSIAAIGSRAAAKRYNLEVLLPSIQGAKNNHTRFIALSALPYAQESADRVSATFVTKHAVGALSDVLLAFSAAGLNLSRILSQPDGTGSYRFFIDIEGGWREMRVREALAHAANACEYFEVLGSYQST